ncbi:receptor-transporting protein 3 [Pempheris klunzingeri]|uniref:receptor-transporting protein 3 n=1 Tax=Pempheris klunzingeri TaxID=3127111 RepID=UPI00398116BA
MHTDRIALPLWTGVFQSKIWVLDDFWSLEFDQTLVPGRPNWGWKQYIRNTTARFRCTECGRTWPSNRVMVVFHMRLMYRQGVVKVRRFRQSCKICESAPMEMPKICYENVDILLENLVEKIRIKCYYEQLQTWDRPSRNVYVRSPHEPANCEGCIEDICQRNFPGFY